MEWLTLSVSINSIKPARRSAEMGNSWIVRSLFVHPSAHITHHPIRCCFVVAGVYDHGFVVQSRIACHRSSTAASYSLNPNSVVYFVRNSRGNGGMDFRMASLVASVTVIGCRSGSGKYR